MTLSVHPTSLPPMNTAGTAGFRPRSRTRAFSISFPLGCSSSPTIVGFAPISRRRLVTVWHMQQELVPKITTARCPASFVTCSIDQGGRPVLSASAGEFSSRVRRFDFELFSLAYSMGRLAYIAMELVHRQDDLRAI
ncbi:hypothetical protein D1007_36322 [Hordeum vulgare]|nr:hypothetical protein D1007_36322 [Hordeum vulgare]